MLTATLTTSTTSGQLFILETCGDVDSCQKAHTGGTGELVFQAPQTGTYYLVVDSSSTFSTADYTLDWKVQTGLACPPGEYYCAGPNTAARCNEFGTADVFTYACQNACLGGYCEGDAMTSPICARTCPLAPTSATGSRRTSSMTI